MAQQSSQATASWYPQLTGLNLPRELTNGVGQVFALVYSLRDTVQQLSAAVGLLVEYGTHRDRVNTLPAASVPKAALYFETDRGNVIYQARLPEGGVAQWFYVGGIWFDTLNQRPAPADLSANDQGLLFWATDTNQLYRWDSNLSPPAWVAM